MNVELKHVARYKVERASFAYDSLREAHAKQGKPLPLFDDLSDEDKLAWIECTDKVCSKYRSLY
jgi:hypothetical protein